MRYGPESKSDIVKAGRTPITMAAMTGALVLLFILATAVGAVNVPFLTTAGIFLEGIGIDTGQVYPESLTNIIMFVRLPRVIAAMLVGAGLAASGAVMQGMFRNPMADPGIIGVSSGASLGAVLAIALGAAAKSILVMPAFAAFGALAAGAVIYALSSSGGKIPVMNLILSGIAVSMFLGALTTMILVSVSGEQAKQFLFWSVGSLSGRQWVDVKIALPPIVICIIIMQFFARDLNVMLLGEEEAQAVGLDPAKARRLMLALASVAAASAVCVSGTVSFVGLIVPHIMRLLVGPDHRRLLPASALGGAILLVGCDIVARLVLAPREVGVGIVTSLIGAPFFLYLLLKVKRKGGAL